MTDTIYLVSGEMEKEALKKHFKIQSSLISNSHTAKPSVMAKFVSSAIIPKRKSISRVVVIMDREARPQSCDDFRGALLLELKAKFPDVEFDIAIADMDTECWIFSDTEVCAKYFKRKISPKASFEGDCGAKQIKKYIGQGKYEKMTDGVKLMALVRWSIVEERSASAKSSKIAELLGAA